MFRKLFCVAVLILFIFGCSTTKTTKNAGGYENNLSTGLSFYHQYISTKLLKNEKGELVEVKYVFNSNKKEDVHYDLVNLHLSLLVQNPYNLKYSIWENLEFINLETNKAYFKHRKLVGNSQLLPEELFSIGLPLMLEAYSQIIFSVDVLNESGETIYSTYETVYNTYKYENKGVKIN